MYRRGKAKNGDLDLIISVYSGSVTGILEKLTEILINKGYLKRKLWHSSEVKVRKQPSEKSTGRTKQAFDNFEKVTYGSNIRRRIKIKLILHLLLLVYLCICSTIHWNTSTSWFDYCTTYRITYGYFRLDWLSSIWACYSRLC